jgi:hypothetical protein
MIFGENEPFSQLRGGNRIRKVADPDGHVRTALGAYLLAALDDEDASAVELHVLGCRFCQDACQGLAHLPSYLDLLSDGDIRAVVDQMP